MAMDFWEAQRRARRQTTIYLIAFFLMTAAVAFVAELAFRIAAPDYETGQVPYLGIIFTVIIVAVAGFNYYMYRSEGGSYAAESLGAWRVDPHTRDPKERQLLNIVEEMTVAASLPMPAVYVMDAHVINAFAAGVKPDNAVIAVTQGAMQKLTRDELQGVIAHEVGHIYNGDMRIGMRLAAMIAGFVVILYLGLRIMQFGPRASRDRKGANPILIAALILMVAGALSWVAGNILRCAVSRKRESLADACSVQFTRNPDGLLSAFRKLQKEQNDDMPQGSGAYSHLYLNDRSFWGRLFATHPPIEERIAALEADDPHSHNSKTPT